MISLNALDKFATDHLFFQGLCSEARHRTEISTPPTDAEIAVAVIEIRRCVLGGALDEAIAILEKLCPDAVHDPELQLEIRIHKLYELIYNTQSSVYETPQQHKEAVRKALEFSQHLAAFALNAFPDAYSRFTQSMMLFAFPSQAVSLEALRKKRNTLAGNLVSLVRITLGARGSKFSFLFRYLLVISLQAKSFLEGGEDRAAHSELIANLLPWKTHEDDSADHISWSVDDMSFVKSKTSEEYSVAEVQALRERIGISRQQCVQSLRFTNGNTVAALQNELGRLRLNEKLFECLVADYCAARGLEGFDTNAAIQEKSTKVRPEMSSNKANSDSASLVISSSSPKMCEVMQKLRVLMAHADYSDIRHLVSIREILPKTSKRVNFQLSLRHVLCLLYENELAESIHHCREKIGPMVHECPDLLPLLSDVLLLIVYAYDCHDITKQKDVSLSARGLDISGKWPDSGDMKKDSGRINDETSSRFHIKLADAYERVSRFSSMESILCEAYKILESEYGEPKLVTILKQFVTAHNDWQTKNQMKDQFAEKFGIQSLRHGVAHASPNAQKYVSRDSSFEGPSIDAPCEETAAEKPCEETILALMDFLAMSRTEALSAVRNHPLASDPQAMVDFVLNSMM